MRVTMKNNLKFVSVNEENVYLQNKQNICDWNINIISVVNLNSNFICPSNDSTV